MDNWSGVTGINDWEPLILKWRAAYRRQERRRRIAKMIIPLVCLIVIAISVLGIRRVIADRNYYNNS